MRWLMVVWLATVVLVVQGCSSKPEHRPVPEALSLKSKPLGHEGIRYWGDTDDRLFKLAEHQLNAYKEHGQVKERNFLAMSGGGGNGAFSSGILTAWSDSGTRPDFDVVTGISTGAIVAVFAFLGSDYDEVITDLYTNTDDSDIYKTNSIFTIFSKNALLDTTPFETNVRSTITPDILKKIAAEYRKGRLLLVGSTHLDSQRLSIWNMGEIAAMGTEESEKLFEDVILASAAIPGAFPPVQIDVVVEEEIYQELHVDGGMARQVFFFSDAMSFAGSESPYSGNANIYVITNGEFLPKWDTTELSLSYVLGRSMLTLLKYQGRSDVVRIYEKAKEAGMKFHFAFVDESLNKESPKDKAFDRDFMRSLYHFGYTLLLSDTLWNSHPPVFDTRSPEGDLRFSAD